MTAHPALLTLAQPIFSLYRPFTAFTAFTVVALLLAAAPVHATAPAADPAAAAQKAKEFSQQADAAEEAKDLELALKLARQAVAAARLTGPDPALLDKALERQRRAAGMLGTEKLKAKQPVEAMALFEEALATSRERQRREDEQYDLCSVGYAQRMAGRARDAMATYDKALALAKELKLERGELMALTALSEIAQGMEHLPASVRFLQELLLLQDRRGDASGVVQATRALLPLWSEVRPFWELQDLIPKSSAAIKQLASGPIDHPGTQQALAAQHEIILAYLEFLTTAGMLSEVRELLTRQLTAAELAPLGRDAADLQARRTAILARIEDGLGDFAAAERMHREVLASCRQRDDLRGAATALARLGEHFRLAGHYGAALSHCEQAIQTYKSADTWLGQGQGWLCKARVLAELGKRADADKAAGEAAKFGKGVGSKVLMAAALSAAAAGGRRAPVPGAVLQGQAREQWRQAQGASLSASQAALSLYGEMKDGVAMGKEAAALVPTLVALGELTAAKQLTALELQTARTFGDRQSEGVALRLQAEIALADKRLPEARQLAAQALAVAEEVGDGENAARIWDVLARGAVDSAAAAPHTSPRATAILLRKQAVNAVQALRGRAAGLSRELVAAQTRAKEDLYRDLAADLLRDGRLAEAEQVLAMLKEQEFSNFIRGRAAKGAGQSAVATRLDLTKPEQPWVQRYDGARTQLARLGQQFRAVRPSGALPAAEMAVILGGLLPKDAPARAAALEPQLAVARGEFEKLIGELAAAGPQLSALSAQDRRGFLQQKLPRLGAGAVALSYVLQSDRLHVLLATAEGSVHRELAVSAEELAEQVRLFREVLQQPNRDPRPAAQALHKLLLAPLEADLQKAKATTLMLALDGPLRYVPFAALHDGKRYLVEQYALTLYNAAARDSIDRAPRKGWTVAALGVSEGAKGFSPLPGVPAELLDIVRQSDGKRGIMPGTLSLDAAFTREALVAALRAKPAVLHLASHFHFDPAGSEAESFLLLGKGRTLSLAEFAAGDFPLDQLDLLTLSACQTALGASGRDGVEVEGFGVMAQRKGAAGVMATLWPVADASTSLFMSAFYRQREGSPKEGPQVSKAAALRATQLRFIQGDLKAAAGEVNRGAEALGQEEPAKADAGAAKSPGFAHPYYWAPFVLMGNWL